MSPVSYAVAEGVATITLDRPERKNAITGPLGVALAEAFETAAADENVQSVLFQGAGGAFCSGLDLKFFQADPPPEWMPDFPAIWRRAHRAMFNCPHPIVGALERYAINGGAALAIACDLLVAGEDAFLQVGEIQLGMAAPYNLAWLRLRHSEAVAARIALIGDRLSAPTLLELGLANEVVTDDAVLERARTLATTLASYPAGAGTRIKAGLRQFNETDADAWFDRVMKLS